MVKLNKNELELITQVLKRAESISRDVNPESFIYSDDMYIGRNDSCRTALYAIDNKEFLEDFGEEEFEEIVWDELKLYEDYLYEKQAKSEESEEISEKITEVKKLIKKIKPYDE
ncbi:hypothetical protein HNP88_000951 [Methanococcus maripaludis]|uniref:Uncharacterized protein n=1 Tax=Methanococcus maripaludis TaxID=39152 RepID=A0A7J9NMR8_METMI|nr:hypothetical protein [Methanococcus maripaludis]MBA2846767.1 hypothetical protein [Methanococcus maripaludis]